MAHDLMMAFGIPKLDGIARAAATRQYYRQGELDPSRLQAQSLDDYAQTGLAAAIESDPETETELVRCVWRAASREVQRSTKGYVFDKLPDDIPQATPADPPYARLPLSGHGKLADRAIWALANGESISNGDDENLSRGLAALRRNGIYLFIWVVLERAMARINAEDGITLQGEERARTDWKIETKKQRCRKPKLVYASAGRGVW